MFCSIKAIETRQSDYCTLSHNANQTTHKTTYPTTFRFKKLETKPGKG